MNKCTNIAHYFAENADICECRMTTRYKDECGFEKWTDCGKHGAVKSLQCPKCEMARVKPLLQFCDCYDYDFRKAVIKLAEIADKQIINDSIKTTAAMYVETAYQIDRDRYTKNLEERLEHERLHGGVIQALAERERIIGIIEGMLKRTTEDNEIAVLQKLIEKIK